MITAEQNYVQAQERYAYALETKRLADELWGYILIHPIKWVKGYREVKRRLSIQEGWPE